MIDSGIESYGRLLDGIDKWFGDVQRSNAGRMRCSRGCTLCCYGLFDISFPDALIVAEGLSRLHRETRAAVTSRAEEIHETIRSEAHDLSPPYLLIDMSEERVDQIVEHALKPRCPFLGEPNECLIYAHRPLACRLEGAPMVDLHDGLFGDWCELNFTEGVPADALKALQMDYRKMQEIEGNSTEHLTQVLLKTKLRRATVFIPSLVVEFETFWMRLLSASKAQRP